MFETGSRFTADGEGRAAAFAWCGAAAGPHWSAPTRTVDFFDAKGVIEALAGASGLAVEFAPVERPFLVSGRAAEARVIDRTLTKVRRGPERRWESSVSCCPPLPKRAASLLEKRSTSAKSISRLVSVDGAGDDVRAAALPRFPSIVRDISILVDEALPAAAVRGTIRSVAPDTLVSIVEFDRYQGKGVPEGRISLSVRLTFRASDRTLTDDEAQAATERIVEALRAAHNAERR